MYQSAKELFNKGMRKAAVVIDNKTGQVISLVGGTALATNAHAEVPAGVLTAITGAATDVGVIGAAILVVVVAIAGYAWLRRPIH